MKKQDPIETPKKVKLEEVLSKKEGVELKPRIKEALSTLFEYFDKGIHATSKVKEVEVNIWSTISELELDLIANALIENGQQSKVIATLTRRMARDYQKVQLGIILIPRFYMTYSHYMHNGFALPFGGNKK